MFKKLGELFSGFKKREAQPVQIWGDVPIRKAPSPAMQAILDRTMTESVQRGAAVDMFFLKSLGPGYRMAVNVQKANIALAKAGSDKVELELPVFILGTELPEPEGFAFVFPWAHEMFDLPPFPVWTEFANEVQTIGGGSDGVEEFCTPVLKYRTEEELNFFYNAIQGWANLDAFYRLRIGQGSIVVFLCRGAV